MKNDSISRRQYLAASAAVGAGLLLPHRRVMGANGDIRVAIIGIRSKGNAHIRAFKRIPGVRVVALCDADRNILAQRAEQHFTKNNEPVDTCTDMREIFDRNDIDAVATATPNHWHSLLTIWACQSGKDVYVEKPVSHCIWEGERMVEAARKYNRIVQTGTQSRSARGTQQFMRELHAGKWGRIKVARGFCYKRRPSIGKVDGPQQVPDHIDYNLWSGPRDTLPLIRKQFHYDWHWQWPYGNGDIGNQGIHQMDLCRWALNQDALPPSVTSFGGRFGYDDDGQTPNTLVSVYDYQPAPLIFEVRGLTAKPETRSMDHYRGTRVGIVIETEAGYWVGTNGGTLFDWKGETIQKYDVAGPETHQANFIQAVRSRKVEDLEADIQEGHLSSAICHMGDISYRTGQPISRDELKELAAGDSRTAEAVGRMREHVLLHDTLSERSAVQGPHLTFDASAGRFTGNLADQANPLLRDSYREPFVVPEKV